MSSVVMVERMYDSKWMNEFATIWKQKISVRMKCCSKKERLFGVCNKRREKSYFEDEEM